MNLLSYICVLTPLLLSAAVAPPSRGPLADEVEDAAKVSSIGPGASGPRVIRAQILLDRARFSPGEIDGRYGEDLGIAVKGYQEKHNLKTTGVIDSEMWKLLNVDRGQLLVTYATTAADARGPFEKIPKDVQQQAQMKSLPYETPAEELGERFHIAPKLLAQLNPGKDLTTAGTQLIVPSVRRGPARLAQKVVVSKSKKTVTAMGPGGVVLAQYPTTIGGPHDPLPIGNWTITIVQQNPWFLWNPERFWNVDLSKATAKLPPGPNNPAGLVWMGLSKEHYGIHGSPEPGDVRHGESYGCIRLTNWDAEDLSHMVRRGTPAILEE